MTTPNLIVSTKGAPKPPDPKSILLRGPEGTGKTAFLLQFPRVLVIDIDLKLDGPERFVRKLRPDLEYRTIRPCLDAKGLPLPSAEVFDNTLAQVRALKPYASEFDWLGFDNATRLSEFLIKRIHKVQGREVLEDRDWGTYGSAMLGLLLDVLRELNKHVVVLSHEKIKEVTDKRTRETLVIERKASVLGQVGDNLGSYFTDVWRMDSKPGPGGVIEYTLESQPTTLDALKSSIGLPAKLRWNSGELGWAKLEPYMKGIL